MMTRVYVAPTVMRERRFVSKKRCARKAVDVAWGGILRVGSFFLGARDYLRHSHSQDIPNVSDSDRDNLISRSLARYQLVSQSNQKSLGNVS